MFSMKYDRFYIENIRNKYNLIIVKLINVNLRSVFSKILLEMHAKYDGDNFLSLGNEKTILFVWQIVWRTWTQVKVINQNILRNLQARNKTVMWFVNSYLYHGNNSSIFKYILKPAFLVNSDTDANKKMTMRSDGHIF